MIYIEIVIHIGISIFQQFQPPVKFLSGKRFPRFLSKKDNYFADYSVYIVIFFFKTFPRCNVSYSLMIFCAGQYLIMFAQMKISKQIELCKLLIIFYISSTTGIHAHQCIFMLLIVYFKRLAYTCQTEKTDMQSLQINVQC